jgi:tRNA(Ile)-lysidine synthase
LDENLVTRGKKLCGASGAQRRLLTVVAGALRRAAISRGETMLAAVSGGPDSVALLLALWTLREEFGFALIAAHLNHGLRGAESDRDEAFVRALCARLGVELVAERAAALNSGSGNLEERARALRRRFLERTAEAKGASRVALGHQRDDQAETVLMRLLRGTGIAGLGAMAEVGPGRLIRPMLELGRAEIMEFLAARKAEFVRDRTNEEGDNLRSRLRCRLLPLLEREHGAGLSRRLAELAREAGAVDRLLEKLAQAELDAISRAPDRLDLARLVRLGAPLAPVVLRLFLARAAGSLRGIARVHLEALWRLCIAGPPNGRLDLPGGWQALRSYGELSLKRGQGAAAPQTYRVRLSLCGRTEVAGAGFIFESALLSANAVEMPGDLWSALFDAQEAAEGLVARNFTPGDRVRPFGLGGSRKVKELFIERKVPRPLRALYPMVMLGDEIAWVPGLVRGQPALVTEKTREVVRLRARAGALGAPWRPVAG